MILPPEHRDLEITDKITLAQKIFQSLGTKLKSDPVIAEMLKETVSKSQLSAQLMRELSVTELCRQCDEEEGGSCCGAGIENRYDAILLLLNLLAGIELPSAGFDEKSCYFLGQNGCVLKIRHTLCVNFLCSGIEESLSIEQLVRLQEVLGDEIDTTFLLYEAVKDYLEQESRSRN